jgi:hypothetical protein
MIQCSNKFIDFFNQINLSLSWNVMHRENAMNVHFCNGRYSAYFLKLEYWASVSTIYWRSMKTLVNNLRRINKQIILGFSY